MLNTLRIRNFAIIDDVEVNFGEGLNVISGETGTGKSILASAILVLLGDRANQELIRTSKDEAVVEAVFDINGREEITRRLDDLGAPGDNDELIIRRIISRGGKGKSYINGALFPARLLSEVNGRMIELTGQHEHQELLKSSRQLELLDDFGGLKEKSKEVDGLLKEIDVKLKEIHKIRMKERERSDREELLSFQVKEIEAAKLTIGEDEGLEGERKILSNAERLFRVASDGESIVYSSPGSITERLAEVSARLKEVCEIDDSLNGVSDEIETALYQLEESASSLRSYADRIEINPSRLEEIEERLNFLRALKKKYGGSIQGVLDYVKGAKKQLNEIMNEGENLERLKESLEKGYEKALKSLGQLSSKRKVAAARLSKMIKNEVRDLGMKGARFEINVNDRFIDIDKEYPTKACSMTEPAPLIDSGAGSDMIRSSGVGMKDEDVSGDVLTRAGKLVENMGNLTEVEFLLSLNPDEDLKPFSRIISGGELSRIMLAFKQILMRLAPRSTLVFDEVDTGIGGRMAEVVGRKLLNVSGHHQVICITHLPPIAARAGTHFGVIKETKGGRTFVRIKKLQGVEREREISRMLGGREADGLSIEYARDLLKKASIEY